MTQTSTTRSWVASANGHVDFPLQNLPLGVFSIDGGAPRSGVAIGDHIFDLEAALDAGLFEGAAKAAATNAPITATTKLPKLNPSTRPLPKKTLIYPPTTEPAIPNMIVIIKPIL